MIDLTKWTNDELCELYGRIVAELAKRNSQQSYTYGAPTFVPPLPPPLHDGTLPQPSVPFATVTCGQ